MFYCTLSVIGGSMIASYMKYCKEFVSVNRKWWFSVCVVPSSPKSSIPEPSQHLKILMNQILGSTNVHPLWLECWLGSIRFYNKIDYSQWWVMHGCSLSWIKNMTQEMFNSLERHIFSHFVLLNFYQEIRLLEKKDRKTFLVLLFWSLDIYLILFWQWLQWLRCLFFKNFLHSFLIS